MDTTETTATTDAQVAAPAAPAVQAAPDAPAAQNRGDRPKVDWEDAKSFTDDDTGLTVRVRKLPLYHPRFNFEIGQMVPERDGKPAYFGRFLRTNFGPGGLQPLNADALVRLIAKAEVFVVEEMQVIEDKIAADKMLAEKRRASPTMRLGKTERDREKGNHERNLSRRREEDRARARGGTGGGGGKKGK